MNKPEASHGTLAPQVPDPTKVVHSAKDQDRESALDFLKGAR